MSTARNPLSPAKPRREETINVLSEHLDDADAEILLRRIETADEDAKTAADWPTVKRRILNSKLASKT